MVDSKQEGIMRGLMLGVGIGVVAALLWVIEVIRRDGERRKVAGHLWPRPDGSARSYGEVWDHSTPASGVAT
jgi:hypothetical protein